MSSIQLSCSGSVQSSNGCPCSRRETPQLKHLVQEAHQSGGFAPAEIR